MLLAWSLSVLLCAAFISIIFIKLKKSKYFIAAVLLVVTAISNYSIIKYDVYNIVWLCNFTSIITVFLLFRFNQYLFDIFFYYSLHALSAPFFDPTNSAAKGILASNFFLWIFIMKHFLPIICITYLFYLDNRKLTEKALKRAVICVSSYFAFVVLYNYMFDQNILYTQEPGSALKYYGPWPIYNLVNGLLVVIGYYGIFLLIKKLNLVQSKQKNDAA